MNIPNIRLLNQQLLNPLFREPKELVSWMGAMQAQNYSMVKWAVGMRLKSATIQTVEKALREGIGFRADFAYSCDASYVASGGGRGYPLDAETFRATYYFGK